MRRAVTVASKQQAAKRKTCTAKDCSGISSGFRKEHMLMLLTCILDVIRSFLFPEALGMYSMPQYAAFCCAAIARPEPTGRAWKSCSLAKMDHGRTSHGRITLMSALQQSSQHQGKRFPSISRLFQYRGKLLTQLTYFHKTSLSEAVVSHS